MAKERSERKLQSEFKDLDFNMEVKHLDDDLLRYRAFELTQEALRSKTLHCRSVKME